MAACKDCTRLEVKMTYGADSAVWYECSLEAGKKCNLNDPACENLAPYPEEAYDAIRRRFPCHSR